MKPDNRVELVKSRDQERYAVLRAAYELAGGDEMKWFEPGQLAKSSGLSEDAINRALEYLTAEGLLVYQLMGGTSGITHRGVLEYERSIRDPSQATEHFGLNVIQNVSQHFHAAVGSVQTGANSTANVVQNLGAQASEVARLFDAVVQAASALNGNVRQDFLEQLDDLRREVESLKPKPSKVKAFLAGMWTAAEKVVEVAPKVLELSERLGHPLLPK